MRVGENVISNIGSKTSASRGSAARSRVSAARGVGGVLAERLQKRFALGAHGVGGRASGKAVQDRSHLEERVVTERGQGRVCRRAVRGHGKAEHALLRATDAVAAPAHVVEDLAAALVDEEVAADLLRMVRGEPLRAELAAGLLVDDGGDQELAARGAPARARERRRSDDLRRDLRLHVDRAAAPEVAVYDLARPRVVAPLGGVREHRVDVAEVAERGPRLRAAQPREQIRSVGLGAEQLALEPGVREQRLEVLLRLALVAGRIDGVEANEAAEDLLGLGGEGVRAESGLAAHREDPTPRRDACPLLRPQMPARA